jgi:tyrosine-protein phosphatase SIW14
MPRFLRCLFALLIVAVIVGAPWGYALYQHNRLRNFHVVRDGVLYRSGQMTLVGLKRIIHDYGIKTVITLRDAHCPGDEPPDKDEETHCIKEGLKYFRIPPRPWSAEDGSVPAEKGVQVFRQVMSDPKNYPVLVHCFAGIHRTGAKCAIYRMDFEGWSNARAIAEMRDHGYSIFDEHLDIADYLETYRPRRPLAVQPASHSRTVP